MTWHCNSNSQHGKEVSGRFEKDLQLLKRHQGGGVSSQSETGFRGFRSPTHSFTHKHTNRITKTVSACLYFPNLNPNLSSNLNPKASNQICLFVARRNIRRVEVKSCTHVYGHILSVEECLQSEKKLNQNYRESITSQFALYWLPDVSHRDARFVLHVTSDLRSFVWQKAAGFQKRRRQRQSWSISDTSLTYYRHICTVISNMINIIAKFLFLGEFYNM